MSGSLGDFDTSTVIYDKFTTYRPSTGAPYTLAGTPALSVYKDNSATQSTTGVTLTVDFDSVTGLHHYAIDTSADGTFYSSGSFFDVVITTGTVDSVSAVGTVVGRFTLRKTSGIKPTTAGRTLDVSAGGEAGVDWANVGSPTTSLALTGTTIATTQKVDVETIKTQSVAAAAGVTFPATLASTTNITAGTITTVTSVTGLTASDVGSIKTKTDSLTFTSAGKVDANMLAISGSSTAADNLKAGGLGLVSSTCSTGSTTTSIVTNLTEATDDHYNGRVITFTSGVLAGQTTSISDYNGTTKALTVVALTEAPSNTDTFVIS